MGFFDIGFSTESSNLPLAVFNRRFTFREDSAKFFCALSALSREFDNMEANLLVVLRRSRL